MTKQNITLVIAILALVLGGVALYQRNSDNLAGLAEYQKHSFQQGFYAGTGRQLQVTNAGVLTSTGAISTTGTLAAANPTFTTSATTTLGLITTGTGSGGCMNTYATSSATAVSVYFRYATSTALGYNGFVTWKYGVCS